MRPDVIFLIYATVFAIGALVALAELLSRYRDAPWDAAQSKAGLAYIGFNALIAVITLYLLRDVFPRRRRRTSPAS